MSDDPMVVRPPHYGTRRFGIECIAFTRLMMFNPGNAFKYVWRCEDKGNPVQDLEKARTYWGWTWESGEAICPSHHRLELSSLYFRYLDPRRERDWMARVLGDIIFEEWNAASAGIDSAHAALQAGRRP
jgi:hypothetical protein